eukprot:2785120-Prymnesium_polylepis.2
MAGSAWRIRKDGQACTGAARAGRRRGYGRCGEACAGRWNMLARAPAWHLGVCVCARVAAGRRRRRRAHHPLGTCRRCGKATRQCSARGRRENTAAGARARPPVAMHARREVGGCALGLG